VDQAFGDVGRIAIVVSNARYGLFGAAEELTDTQIERQVATYLLGQVQVIRATLPNLRSQDGGRIQQVSSEGARRPIRTSASTTLRDGDRRFRRSRRPRGHAVRSRLRHRRAWLDGPQLRGRYQWSRAHGGYDETPSGDIRRTFASGAFVLTGDAARSVDATIAAGDADRPTLRLALTSTAYPNISKSLTSGLSALEAQRAVAASADRDAVA
jgi:hypothetical protein